MHCRITLRFIDTHPAPVPYDHQYALAALIYDRIQAANEHFGLELHYRKGYKHFCFSWLQFARVKALEHGLLPLSGTVTFELSSPDTEFVRATAEGFLTRPEVELVTAGGSSRTAPGPLQAFSDRVTAPQPPVRKKSLEGGQGGPSQRFPRPKNKLLVERFEVLPEPDLNTATVRFRTLSPIIVRTMRDVPGREKPQVWDLAPTEPQFHTNLYRNLVHRYEDYHDTRPGDDRFALTNLVSTKPKRVRIKNTYNRCWMIDGEMSGSPELVRFAYESGLGEKGSMGFGCIVLRSRDR